MHKSILWIRFTLVSEIVSPSQKSLGRSIIYMPSHCVVSKHQGIELGQVIGLTLITRHPTTS